MHVVLVDNRIQGSLAADFPGHEVRVVASRAMTAEEFREQVRDADAIGVRRVPGFDFDRALVERLPKLQFVHKSGTGLDWLDLPALSEHGILVANNDGFNAASVAEHAVLLALLCLRGTFDTLNRMRSGISRFPICSLS